MPKRRITIRVRGAAYDALMELSKAYSLSPQAVVEKLLVNHQRSIRDDMLCPKELFKNTVAYIVELPFCFPYECELFELQLKDKCKAKIYVERIPKRYIHGRLPFKTLVTVAIELTEEEKQNIVVDKLKVRSIGERLASTAFRLLRSFIVGFRRVTNTYYNIGIIEPPANLEEFKKRAKVIVIVEGKVVDSFTFMPVKENSVIVVKESLERVVREKVLGYITREFSNALLDPLAPSWNYLDAAVISYYKEQWNLAILQSIIAMESALSNLVLVVFKNHFIKRYRSENELKKRYKHAGGLHNKIGKFLIPLLNDLNLRDTIVELRKIMKDIKELYDLRSSIVHEGVEGDDKSAKKSIIIARKFLMMIDLLINSKQTSQNMVIPRSVR